MPGHSVKALLEELEAGKPLPSYAWPGGYPIIYLTRRDEVLCPACANASIGTDDPATVYDVHWEGPPIDCDECSNEIESAYGDPDAP